MNPKVSVVVPVYNVESYFPRCMDSILNQTYKNIEIILVDDGSTDDSGNKCDEYADIDSRVKVIHKENGGLSSARNAGINIATGEWISFIDSDDYVQLTMIEDLINCCIKNHTLMAASGLERVEDKTGKILSLYHPRKEQVVCANDFINLMTLSNGPLFAAWNKIYHKSLWKTFRFPEGRCWEDIAIMYKVVDEAKAVAIVDKCLYHYCIRKGSISQTERVEKYFDYYNSTKDFLQWAQETKPSVYDYALKTHICAIRCIIMKSIANERKEYYTEYRKKLLQYKQFCLFNTKLSLSEKIKCVFIFTNLICPICKMYLFIARRSNSKK